MFAGHDTTSNSLMYSLFAIGTHPQFQQNLFDEIEQIFRKLFLKIIFKIFAPADKTSPLTWEGLSALSYMERFMKEVARRYPTVPLIGRHLDEELVLDDEHVVPRDTTVTVCIRSLHMDAVQVGDNMVVSGKMRQFPEPERFDPDRFLPEAIAARHPFAFAPFSAGARNCIGQKFANTEMKAVLVRILQRCGQLRICENIFRAQLPSRVLADVRGAPRHGQDCHDAHGGAQYSIRQTMNIYNSRIYFQFIHEMFFGLSPLPPRREKLSVALGRPNVWQSTLYRCHSHR